MSGHKRTSRCLKIQTVTSATAAIDSAVSNRRVPIQRIRLVLADDHSLFRDGLRTLLIRQPDFQIVGEAASGTSTLTLVRDARPDVLLLDVSMPDMSGFEVLHRLRAVNLAVHTILLTAAIDRGSIVKALQLGARGIVLKDTSMDLLFKSIRRVHDGEVWINHDAISELVTMVASLPLPAAADQSTGSRDFGLTAREREVLSLIVQGEMNKGIAEKLSVGEDTVKHHLTNIFDKTGASNRLELALFALHHRLVAAS